MKRFTLFVLLLLTVSLQGFSQRVTDKLDRGLVAVPANANGGSGSGNFVSWRILADEYYDVTYNLYANGALLKSGLNVSCYTHTAGTNTTKYQVAAVVKGVEQELSSEVTRWNTGYYDIVVSSVVDRKGNIVTSQYALNDISLGDVDGDGVVEFLIKRNFTGDILASSNTTKFHHYECYNLKGERLWWIDLGPNMISGPDEQYDIVLFDWDRDGKAEALMRGVDNMIIHTASGETINVGSTTVDTRSSVNTTANMTYTNQGNEYLLYLEGATGQPYEIGSGSTPYWISYPLPRGNAGDWGDGYGHRSTKHYFGAPFLDGRNPYIFLGRGCYTKHHMKAFSVNPETHKLSLYWEWGNDEGWGDPWFGNGFHNFGIADVDWDGRDEIVFGSMVIDDNGNGLSTTGLGHGDAQHCRDFDPYRHGQEIFTCNEDEPAMNYRDATTSKLYYRLKSTGDDGRALCGNFTNSYPGSLGRSTQSAYISTVSDRPFPETAPGDANAQKNHALVWSHLNFRIFWDGDLCDEVLDSPGNEREAAVYKFPEGRIFTSSGCNMNNGSKNNPCAQGDIFGDWREEIVVRADNNTKIRIYTTAIPTTFRIPSLWLDHQYRNAMVWQPMGYNQPPHLSYFLGQMEGITVAPPPYTMSGRVEIPNNGTISSEHQGQQVLVCETNDTHITVSDGANPDVAMFNVPSWVQGTNSNKTDGTAVINRTYYTCTVEGGAFTGKMRLVKQGDGILSLPDVEMTYTGNTDIWAGTLNFNGSLLSSTLWLNRFAELNSNGQFRSIKADYASVVRPGGSDALGSITTDTLVLGFGSRLVLDAYSEGLQIDHINAGVLKIENKTGNTWEVYGPEYITPIIEVVKHTNGGEKLAPGKYLIGEIGKVDGNLEKIKIIGFPTQRVTLSVEDGKLYLQVETLRDPAIVYWTGSESTTWDFAKTENFQNIEGEKDIFMTGDKVIFDDAAKKFAVTISDDFEADTVIVDGAKAYTFNGLGSLVGSTSLVKRGTGTLTISTENTYTGSTLISGGTVKVGILSNSTKAYGNLGTVSSSNQKFIIENGATLQTTAAVQMGTPIRLRSAEGGVLNNSANFDMDSPIVGTTLTKKGTGSLICFQPNTALNRLIIVGGAVAERNGNAAQTVEFQGGTLYDDTQSTTHAIYVPAGKTGTWQLTGVYYTAYANKITGEGTLTIVPRNTVSRVRITGDWSQFEGTIKHTTTDIWLPLDGDKGIPKGTLNIASGCTVTNVAKAFTIGCLTGAGTLAQPVANFQNSSAVSGNNTWNVGNSNGKDFTFSGTITDNNSSNHVIFNKVGTCKMTFTGKGTFAGTCRVNAGELCLNSSKTDIMLGSSTLTVVKGATLSGTGTLGNSIVSVATGAIIRSGITEDNPAGNLKFSGKNLTVSGTAQTYIASNTSYSKFTNIGILRLNGTLVVRGAEDLALSVGDEIQIFDASTITLGNSLVLDLCEPNHALGLTWDTSRLSEGILVVAPAPDAVISLQADELRNAEIYTLSGQRLSSKPTQPGVYVIDGRKTLLRR